MAKKKVFVSFDFDNDKTLKTFLRLWIFMNKKKGDV
jgi:hypothetical protein